MQPITTLLCALILLPATGYTQLHDRPLRINEELPSPFVTDIDQDGNGFVWISTYAGLCRYDGTRIRVFSHVPGDIRSLPGTSVAEVVVDKPRNCLWVGTDGGLCHLDPRTGEAEHLQLPDTTLSRRTAEALLLDDDGSLWFSIDQYGLGHLLPETGIIKLHPFDIDTGTFIPSGLGAIRDIAADQVNHDRLWIGTSGGIIDMRKSSGVWKIRRFASPDPQGDFYLNQIRTVYPHGNGTLYLGTWSAGMIIWDPARGDAESGKIPQDAFAVIGERGIMPPIIGRDPHHLWVSLSDAICVLDTRRASLEDCFRLTTPNNRYFPLVIELVDRAGRLWASSEQGVYVFDPAHALVHNYGFPPGNEAYFYVQGTMVEIPEDSSILITYEHCAGAYLFDRNTQTFTLVEPPPENMDADKAFIGEDMIRLRDGTVVVAGREFLYRYDPGEQQLVRWVTPLDELGMLWRCLAEDMQGNLWLGTSQSGLVRFDQLSHEITVFAQELQANDMDWPNPIDRLFVDSRGNVWLSMWSSSAVFQAATETILTIPMIAGAKYEPSQFAEDRHGNIWFGVKGSGLAFIDSDNLALRPDTMYTAGAGIPDQDILAVACDHNDNVWMITPSGLQAFNPNSGYIRRLTEHDGLITYDPNFNRNPMTLTSLHNLSDGSIAYVPRAGLAIFDPDHLPLNTEIPDPYIFGISVGDTTRFYAHGNAPADLTVSHREGPLVVHLSSLGFTHSAHITIQYKLLQDAPWTTASNGDVVFNTLNQGRHTVIFRAVNSDGMPSPTHRFGFRVRPPWWLSWWFVAIVAASLAGALWAFVNWRQRSRDALRRREHEIHVLMATLESKALRSQMNPHFLFNIFNTIQELILTGDNDMAYLYTSKFSRLLRMILENAGRDATSIADEKAFLDLYLQLEALRFDDAFTYRVDVEPGLEHHHIPVFMVQPLVENAIRHGLLPKEGDKDLAVRFDARNDLMVCTICDNGVGLPVKATDNGSGRWHAIGLIRRRLEMTRSGRLTIHNRKEGGVVAELTLPYS